MQDLQRSPEGVVGTFELGTVTECAVTTTVGGGREGAGRGAHYLVTVGGRNGDEGS
jgi:hypothetical protein